MRLESDVRATAAVAGTGLAQAKRPRVRRVRSEAKRKETIFAKRAWGEGIGE